MGTRRPCSWIAATGLIALSVFLSADSLHATSGYGLLDILVWGADMKVDVAAYPPDVRADIDRLRRRSETYRSKRSKPAGSPELAMVYEAQVRYERRLIAMSTSPGADSLALAYVSELHPCYEWEGGHDCPEREAAFAAKYVATHPTGPFSQYLPLLEAHRWLCAAEAYESEKAPAEVLRTRGAYERAISSAVIKPLLSPAASGRKFAPARASPQRTIGEPPTRRSCAGAGASSTTCSTGSGAKISSR
jgi:hypothetical protein